MPSPNKALDPRQAFGFGRRKFDDYFQVPKKAAFDPAFSPVARERLLEDQIATRNQDALQREWAAEDTANQLLDEAPNMRPRQLERELLRDPRVFSTPQGQNLQDFLASRNKRKEARVERSKADQTLSNYFVKGIQDPSLRDDFNIQIANGVPFEQARDDIWRKEYDQKHAVSLAEAGVPPTEYEALKAAGRFDPILVAQRVAQAKKEGTRGGGETQKRLDIISDAMSARKRVLDARMEDPAKDAAYQRYSELYDKTAGELMDSWIPPVEAAPVNTQDQPNPLTVVPPGGVPAAPVAPALPEALKSEEAAAAYMASLTPEEAKARYEENKVKSQENDQVARAWTQAKKSIGRRIFDTYPDRDEAYGNPAIQAAKAILDDVVVPASEGDEGNEMGVKIPYADKVLRQIGLKPSDKAFKEPGGARGWWAGQDVRNAELLREWADSFLREKGLIVTGDEEALVEEISPLQAEADAIADKYK